jgi:hypothetical protein
MADELLIIRFKANQAEARKLLHGLFVTNAGASEMITKSRAIIEASRESIRQCDAMLEQLPTSYRGRAFWASP